jgi:polyisoprenyl-phosphate glycosyltransferase
VDAAGCYQFVSKGEFALEAEQLSIAVVLPVYNDWESFKLLLEEISAVVEQEAVQLHIVAVDDGSASVSLKYDDLSLSPNIGSVEVLHLTRNLGHQKAIAIGLAYVAQGQRCDTVITMDSDGEDRPEDIIRLINASAGSTDKIVFAERTKRSEGIGFRFFYQIYKSVYYILTGSSISFGNFCIIPLGLLKRLVFVSEIWNHFSAGVLKSKLPITTIPTVRGCRIAGRSKMNLAALVMHGLSAISVHMDIVAVRVFLASIALIILPVVGIFIVFGVRFLTTLAIPGWATNVTIGLLVILFQAFLVSFLLVFVILTTRTSKLFIPCLDYAGYIFKIEKVFP